MRRSLRSFVGRALGCRGVDLTQRNWTVRFGISDGSVFTSPDADPAFLALGHKDVEGGLWTSLRHALLILLPLAILRIFWLSHPR
jgi:hypothetical protein